MIPMLTAWTAFAFTAMGGVASTAANGTVTGLQILPSDQRTEVLIAVDGSVEVREFSMEGPYRLVVDILGARYELDRESFGEVSRGGIRTVRASQYSEDVVRVVLELDGPLGYTLLTGSGYVRLSLENQMGDFEPWRAEAGRADGDSDPAAWESAAQAFTSLSGEPVPTVATIRYRWAEALIGSGGSRPQAAELLRQAREAAVRMGAEPLRADIDQLAKRARLDLSGIPDGAAAGDGAAEPDLAGALGLTARERDVLALVAAGRSNRQIAEELYIAPKTASVHVSNILAKLEVSSRGEAAALAHRLRLVPVATD
jgi:DNA-binding CsgD family transcriptional regulator